ncbi:hypothetical protein SUDANB9_03567 [Streptomyces sp. enrichment culture]
MARRWSSPAPSTAPVVGHRTDRRWAPLIAVIVLDGAKFWLGTAVVVAVLVPLMLSAHDPTMWHVLMPVAVGFCLLCAYFCQIGRICPRDDISWADAQEAAAQAYAESEQLRAKKAALQQAKAAQNAQARQAAIWAQIAQINQAQHPGQDIYWPYGQSPPL